MKYERSDYPIYQWADAELAMEIDLAEACENDSKPAKKWADSLRLEREMRQKGKVRQWL